MPPALPSLGERDAKALEVKLTNEKNKDGTSLMGLDKPLFGPKNPGIIPLDFLAALIGCLAFPSRKPEEMWDGIYVRQNTGIGMAKATDH